MFELNGNSMFPCPFCAGPREVRLTKKGKPYVTCDPCGIQVFIRGPAGIAAFERLVDRGTKEDLDQAVGGREEGDQDAKQKARGQSGYCL